MNHSPFLDDLENGRFRNEQLSKRYGYVDFIIQAGPLPSPYAIHAVLPKISENQYISNMMGIPLPNSEFLYYCRAGIESTISLFRSPERPLFVADSWESLFDMDYPFWMHVFDAEATRTVTLGTVTNWRGKFSELTEHDKLVKAYVPGLFAGDTPPDLEIKHRHFELLFSRKGDEREHSELILVRHAINDELIRYLQKHPRDMYKLKPRQFEELISEILKSFGWQVDLTKETRDGGYDIFAISKDAAGVSTSWIVECKRYAPDRKVGIDIVRSLCGVKTDMKVGQIMIATTSSFSSDVVKAKNSRYDLDLRDYSDIVEWLGSYKR